MKKFVDPHYQGQSKVNYTFNEKEGQITKAPAYGWEPEFEATQRAWDEINEDLQLTVNDIHEGKLSPLAYHMKTRLMDSKLLAAETGICHLFVKRHLQSVSSWKSLSQQKKSKYATALSISLLELEKVPEKKV